MRSAMAEEFLPDPVSLRNCQIDQVKDRYLLYCGVTPSTFAYS